MSKLTRKSTKGFTLIELMIVVAIIGILAAIAIPNFLRFQLKSKSSEGKVNLAAIRTAEESYLAEFGVYVGAIQAPLLASLGSAKTPFVEIPIVGADFNTLGWTPEGQVFFSYGVAINAAAPGASFTATATADIDADGIAAATSQHWGYVKGIGPNPVAGLVGLDPICVTTGTWNAAVLPAAPTMLNTVGPCDGVSGQSIF
jgi:type IV pilus assembly protein PilA